MTNEYKSRLIEQLWLVNAQNLLSILIAKHEAEQKLIDELSRAISDFKLIHSLGGVEVCKKIIAVHEKYHQQAMHFSMLHNDEGNLRFYEVEEEKPDNAISIAHLYQAVKFATGDNSTLPAYPWVKT